MRGQPIWVKACSVLAAALMALLTIGGLVTLNILGVVITGVGAWACAMNLRPAIGRQRRLLAIAAQILNLLQIGFYVLLALFLLESGRRHQEIGSWVGLGVAALLVVFGIATWDGVRAYQEEAE